MGRTNSRMTYQETLLNFREAYVADFGSAPASATDMARWVIDRGNWEPPRRDKVKFLARDLSRAMRSATIPDARGRPVRMLRAARYPTGNDGSSGASIQQTLWSDIREATREHMEVWFQQRRSQIVGDCMQLKRDLDYFNEDSRTSNPIQIEFDFTDDVIEGDQPREYQPVDV